MPYQIAKERLSGFHTKNEKYYPAAFFIAGFIFDIATLDRIDNIYLILQQAFYILFVGYVLFYQTLEKTGHFRPQEKTSFFGRQFNKLWKYNNEALHFILGSLLSVYFLFYFVSSSLATSFIFLVGMFAVLVANEIPSLQRKGPWLKYILYWLCIFSFFSVLIPVAIGFTNVLTLLLAVSLGLGMCYGLYKAYEKKFTENRNPTAAPATVDTPVMYETSSIDLRRNVAAPAAGVAATLLILYFLKLLPPLPLSIQYIGVYHTVQKQGEVYELGYDRPWYKFWQYGAQTFHAQPGDKIHVFARIFSPSNFKDDVVFHWQKYGKNGWESSDRVNTSIVGGRGQGFRGYSMKSNYEPGTWRVKIETPDGREIGRITFDVEPQPSGPREFNFDLN
jgi:hypothetical protein